MDQGPLLSGVLVEDDFCVREGWDECRLVPVTNSHVAPVEVTRELDPVSTGGSERESRVFPWHGVAPFDKKKPTTLCILCQGVEKEWGGL